MISPGEIYMSDDDVTGRHPVIVVSRELLNRGATVITVMVSSSRLDVRVTLRNCVPFKSGEFGFSKDCAARCETLAPTAIASLDLAEGPLGILDDVTMRDVVRAIGYVIESECEPV